ncbi:MAG: hypothetical protein JWN14_3629 [Chthonomonadales bacterium]|nr:hypothetical protein [Chthonomonadales bacterium]
MRQADKSKKRGRAVVGLVLCALIIATLIWLWSRERLLTEVAHPVLQLKDEKEKAFWFSANQFLLIMTEHESGSKDDRAGVNAHASYAGWHGSADLFDPTTHTRTHLTALTNLLTQTTLYPLLDPDSFEISPDGAWILWDTDHAQESSYYRHTARLDGTHHRDWLRYGSEEYLFFGSHFLVQMAAVDPILVIRDLEDPAKDRKYLEPAPAKAAFAQYAAPDPYFTAVSETGGQNGSAGFAVLDTYHTQDRLALILSDRDESQKAPQPVRAHEVPLPVHTTFHEEVVSPKQQAIFYHLHVSRTLPILSWLQRFFPKIQPKPVLTEELWLSRIDGRDMHKIGHVPTRLDANGTAQEQLEHLQWRPDGKQISFVYHGTLYVLPMDTGK